MEKHSTRRFGWLPQYRGGVVDTRLRAVVPLVLALLAACVLFLRWGGTDLFDHRWQRIDLVNALYFAAAVSAILSALVIVVGWFFWRAERKG